MKIISLSFLFAIFTLSASSQKADWSREIYNQGEKYPGYVINLDGDTIHGFIKAGPRCAVGGFGSSNQNRAQFFLYESDRKPVEKYSPTEIKGYKVADKVYESILYSGGLFKKANFNLVVEEGAIRTYLWYSTVENYSSIHKMGGESLEEYDARRYEIKTIFAAIPEEPVEAKWLRLGFSNRMPELVKAYPELAQKVTDKLDGYRMTNLYDVIKEYNEWAASKN